MIFTQLWPFTGHVSHRGSRFCSGCWYINYYCLYNWLWVKEAMRGERAVWSRGRSEMGKTEGWNFIKAHSHLVWQICQWNCCPCGWFHHSQWKRNAAASWQVYWWSGYYQHCMVVQAYQLTADAGGGGGPGLASTLRHYFCHGHWHCCGGLHQQCWWSALTLLVGWSSALVLVIAVSITRRK